MFENVSVIGGDLRQLTVAKLLKAEGYHVFLYGFDKDIQLETLECETDKDLVLSADPTGNTYLDNRGANGYIH